MNTVAEDITGSSNLLIEWAGVGAVPQAARRRSGREVRDPFIIHLHTWSSVALYHEPFLATEAWKETTYYNFELQLRTVLHIHTW